MAKPILLLSLLQITIAIALAQEDSSMPDADVCNNSSTSKFFGADWCKSLSTTEGCRLGIVNLLFAAAGGDVDSLKKYKESGTDMSLVDYDGRSALHLAAAEGHLESVEYLLKEAKVPSKPKDRWGYLPLDDAQRFNRQNVVDFLNKWYESEQR